MESLLNHNKSINDYDGSVIRSSALIFLGTGCSNSVPNALCLIQPSDPPCNVCLQSLSVPPDQNPNYRCNTSLVIDYYSESDEKHKYILIDVGKTFREQVLRWFTFHKISRVDSIILTHEHADAVLGLDDMRAVQPISPTNDVEPIPIYLSQPTMDRYLHYSLSAACIHHFNMFINHQVMHGEDYISLGFLFGEKSKVAYISDVSRFPASTEYVISKAGHGQLDLLILDTLRRSGSHNVHFCLPQSLEAVKRLCPKQALLIGMGHEFDHYKDNEFLAEWSKREGIPVQLASDGLRVTIDL